MTPRQAPRWTNRTRKNTWRQSKRPLEMPAKMALIGKAQLGGNDCWRSSSDQHPARFVQSQLDVECLLRQPEMCSEKVRRVEGASLDKHPGLTERRSSAKRRQITSESSRQH